MIVPGKPARLRGAVTLALACALAFTATPTARAETWERVTHWLAIEVGPLAVAAGLGPLRGMELPEGEREVRIWVGFGIMEPQDLLQLRIKPDGEAKGRAYQHYFVDATDDEDAATGYRSEHAAFESWMRRYCVEPARTSDSEICRVRFQTEPDWNDVWTELQALGVETLPDEEGLPTPGKPTRDGIGLLVEVREGREYRAYSYSNPSIHAAAAERRRAAEILGLVDRLIGQERRAARDTGPERRPSG